MEKISGILASSPRVTSADLKESGPIRPGAPGFGRAEGSSALRDRKNEVDVQRTSQAIQQTMQDWRGKETLHSNLAKEMSDRFFMQERPAAQAAAISAAEAHESELEPESVVAQSLSPLEPESDEVESAVPQGLYPRGSFIDYRA